MSWYIDSKIAFSPDGIGSGREANRASRAASLGAAKRSAGSVRASREASFGVGLTAGAERLLAVLTRRAPARLSWVQVAMFAGIRGNGRYVSEAIRSLRAHGLIDERRGKAWASQKAIAEAGQIEETARTKVEIVAMWCAKLPTPAPAILRMLASCGPLRAAELAGSIGHDWNKGVATLRSNGLVEIHGGVIRLSDELNGG